MLFALVELFGVCVSAFACWCCGLIAGSLVGVHNGLCGLSSSR